MRLFRSFFFVIPLLLLSTDNAQSSETGQRGIGTDFPSKDCSAAVVSQLVNEAETRFVRGEYAEAYRWERAALACHQANLTPETPPARTAILSRLAELSRMQGRLNEAESWLKQAVAIFEEDRRAPDSLGYASALVGLATIRVEKRRYFEAEPLVRRAIEVCGRLPGQETVKCQQSAMNNLGALHASLDDGEGAERVYHRALALENGAEPDAITAALLHNLATVEHDQGKIADAEKHYRDALTLRRRLLPPSHADTNATADSLRLLLRRSGRKREAGQLRTPVQGPSFAAH